MVLFVVIVASPDFPSPVGWGYSGSGVGDVYRVRVAGFPLFPLPQGVKPESKSNSAFAIQILFLAGTSTPRCQRNVLMLRRCD